MDPQLLARRVTSVDSSIIRLTKMGQTPVSTVRAQGNRAAGGRAAPGPRLKNGGGSRAGRADALLSRFLNMNK